MNRLSFSVMLLACTMPAPSLARDASTPDCEAPPARYLGDLLHAFGEKAVEAINLAGGPENKPSDAKLRRLLGDHAEFSLGGGDVGRPLGEGVAAIRKMAREMRADTFRFLNWDYIPTPVGDRCAKQELTIEFVDSGQHYVFPVKFTFENGRIVAGAGWRRSFTSGPIAPVRD